MGSRKTLDIDQRRITETRQHHAMFKRLGNGGVELTTKSKVALARQ